MDCFKVCFLAILFRGNTAVSIDCSDGSQNLQEETILHISETSPRGTVLVTFSNTYGPLKWAASFNGTGEEYIETFITSKMVGNNTYSFELVKPLDLELLTMVLTTTVTTDVQISVSCQTEQGIVKAKHFLLVIEAVNEFVPVFIKAPFKISVEEATPVGTIIFNVKDKAMDMDYGLTVLVFAIAPYTISELDGLQYVTMDTPTSGYIRLSKELDFEHFLLRGRTYFFINVTVSDEGGLTSVTSINVTVVDSNDQGIEFVYPQCEKPCLNPNYTVYTNESYLGELEVIPVGVMARDLDTLKSAVRYSLISTEDSDYFSIDETTGRLYKRSPLVNDTYGYRIMLEGNNQFAQRPFNFSVTIDGKY